METNAEKQSAEHFLTPRALVAALDKHIVGQHDAKRAVAVAVRNRWRRRQLDPVLAADVSPRNIMLIGSTGVGKTEIARRLARLTGAPFIKVEATRYTEVGYYGRDVESMVRELVDQAVQIVKSDATTSVQAQAEIRTRERLLDLLCPPQATGVFHAKPGDPPPESGSYQRTREKIAEMLDDGAMEEREVEITIEQKQTPVMMGGASIENMDVDFQGMIEKLIPTSRVTRRFTVANARKILLEQESEKLIDDDKISQLAIELAENLGIIFIDEIDKVIAGESRGADVSRQGVQRDLLPIVEGTSVQTKRGYVKTDHILFFAAGAFHHHQPSELMPELQGRFPIRVELQDLTADDFYKILLEPENSLIHQYQALLKTENVELEFQPEALRRMADLAFEVNQSTQNIGARRLYTILERVVEEISFEASDMEPGKIVVDVDLVNRRLSKLVANEDLSRFIL